MIDVVDDETGAATVGRRRTMAVVVLVGLAGYVTGGLVGQPVTSLLSAGIMALAWLLLRRAVDTLADRPDDQLDERQVSVRDRAYLMSYRVLGGVVAVLVIATIGWDLFDVKDVSTTVTQSMMGGLLFLMIGLPTCIVGWTDRAV